MKPYYHRIKQKIIAHAPKRCHAPWAEAYHNNNVITSSRTTPSNLGTLSSKAQQFAPTPANHIHITEGSQRNDN